MFENNWEHVITGAFVLAASSLKLAAFLSYMYDKKWSTTALARNGERLTFVSS
jgi:hypothetical protein